MNSSLDTRGPTGIIERLVPNGIGLDALSMQYDKSSEVASRLLVDWLLSQQKYQ
jgi:hypothetical protein